MAMFKRGATRPPAVVTYTTPPDLPNFAKRIEKGKAELSAAEIEFSGRPVRWRRAWAVLAAVCAAGLALGLLSGCAATVPANADAFCREDPGHETCQRMPSSSERGAEPWGYSLMCRREPENPLCERAE